jgi:hypothetical protein
LSLGFLAQYEWMIVELIILAILVRELIVLRREKHKDTAADTDEASS